MKKIILITFIALFLVGTTFAAISFNNRNEKIDNARYDKAVELGINIYTTQDNSTAQGYRRCLISNSDFNLPCSKWYNGELDETVLDNWEAERMWGERGILQVQIDRDNKPVEEVVGEGTTTLSK